MLPVLLVLLVPLLPPAGADPGSSITATGLVTRRGSDGFTCEDERVAVHLRISEGAFELVVAFIGSAYGDTAGATPPVPGPFGLNPLCPLQTVTTHLRSDAAEHPYCATPTLTVHGNAYVVDWAGCPTEPFDSIILVPGMRVTLTLEGSHVRYRQEPVDPCCSQIVEGRLDRIA
jgi:hypothetical protein